MGKNSDLVLSCSRVAKDQDVGRTVILDAVEARPARVATAL